MPAIEKYYKIVERNVLVKKLLLADDRRCSY